MLPERGNTAQDLSVWANTSPSVKARALVSPLSDIHRSALKVAELIEQLRTTKTLAEQLQVLAALEVWMFDELADRIETARPLLEEVSKETSRAVG